MNVTIDVLPIIVGRGARAVAAAFTDTAVVACAAAEGGD
jgi:hypothetical protein